MNKWLASIAFQKVAKRVASFAVSALVAGVAKAKLDTVGITVDVDPTVATGSVFAILEFARNFVKTKFNLKWL